MPHPADSPDHPSTAVSHNRRVIATNALFGYVGSVALTALRFVIKLVLIRSLDPADFGRVITTQNLQALVLTVAGLNLGDAVLRFVGRHRQEGTGLAAGVVRQASRFVILLGTAGTVFLLAAAGTLASQFSLGPQGAWAVTFAAVAIVPTLLGDIVATGFQGLNRTWVKVGVLDLPRSLATLSGYVLLASLGWATYAGAVSVQLVAALLSAVLIMIAFRRTPEFRERAQPVPLRDLLVFSVPLFISLIIGGALVGSGIPLVLAAQEAPEMVAVYAIALTMAPLLQLPAVALESAAVPVWAAATGTHTGSELARSFAEVTRWGLLLGLLVFIPLAAAPREWLELLFGSRYAGPIGTVEIALAATLFTVVVGPTEGMLMAAGLTRGIVIARVVSGMIALAAAWPLIAAGGVMGAMVAWGVSTVVSNSISAWYVYRVHGIQPFDSRYMGTLAAGTIGVLVSLAVIWTGVEGLGKLAAIVAANTLTIAVAGRLLGAWTPAELIRLVRQSSVQPTT